MFENPGKTIKITAKILVWVGIVGSVVGGMILIAYEVAGLGLLILFGGPLLSWLTCLCLYGFGDLIENAASLAEKKKKIVLPRDFATIGKDSGLAGRIENTPETDFSNQTADKEPNYPDFDFERDDQSFGKS